MNNVRQIRNFAFAMTLGVTVWAMQAHVLAMGSAVSTMAADWDNNWDCEYSIGDGFPPGWSSSGICDFSSDPIDGEFYSGQMCNDVYDACDADCGDPYASYVADWFSIYTSESDPCYSAVTNPENYITWADPSCDPGWSPHWSCSCNYFFMGEC